MLGPKNSQAQRPQECNAMRVECRGPVPWSPQHTSGPEDEACMRQLGLPGREGGSPLGGRAPTPERRGTHTPQKGWPRNGSGSQPAPATGQPSPTRPECPDGWRTVNGQVWASETPTASAAFGTRGPFQERPPPTSGRQPALPGALLVMGERKPWDTLAWLFCSVLGQAMQLAGP